MASTYYKMSEVMDKLQKTEQEVQDLIKQGKLRQYLDAGNPVFKVDEVDKLADEVNGLDLTGANSELDLSLEETGEITLEPDEEPDGKGKDDGKNKTSEGGFGLSQMGDLTMADTNAGTVGINILSGTEDAYKLTEDTKAETAAGEDVDELDQLDADSNLESFGSGSGLLDLSLQADDTSLGAVLDDILPSAEEGQAAAAGEPELIADDDDQMEDAEQSAASPAAGMAAPAGVMPSAPQMMAVVPEDPASTLFGAMMFLPVVALALAGIVLTGAIRDVTPSLTKMMTETLIAEISLVWYVAGGLALVVLLMLALTAMGGPKSPKAAKPAKEKKAKKKKK